MLNYAGGGKQGDIQHVASIERIPWSSLVLEQPSFIGKGAFGVVYRANWLIGKAKKHTVQVAVKIFKIAINDKLTSYASIEQNLIDEARILQRARDDEINDYVVKLFGVSSGVVTPEWIIALGYNGPSVFVEEEGVTAGESSKVKMLALIMKYEAGGTLEGLLYNPTSPWMASTQERIRVLLEIATGLWHLHNNSEQIIVHGDIKPENVLLSADTHVRLSDFGLATAREAISRATKMSSMNHSNSHTSSGTWNYQAPEMSRNIRRNEKALLASRSTDIYALGTLIWEVLAGQKPWHGCDPTDRLVGLREGDNLDMNALPADTPLAVRGIIASCLAISREERPRIDEVRIHLEPTVGVC